MVAVDRGAGTQHRALQPLEGATGRDERLQAAVGIHAAGGRQQEERPRDVGGKRGEARGAWQAAFDKSDAKSPYRTLIQAKLDSLGEAK